MIILSEIILPDSIGVKQKTLCSLSFDKSSMRKCYGDWKWPSHSSVFCKFESYSGFKICFIRGGRHTNVRICRIFRNKLDITSISCFRKALSDRQFGQKCHSKPYLRAKCFARIEAETIKTNYRVSVMKQRKWFINQNSTHRQSDPKKVTC